MRFLAPLALAAWLCAACASAAVPPYPAATVPGVGVYVCWQGGVTKICTAGDVSGGSSTATIGTVPLWNNFEGSGAPGLLLGPHLAFGDPTAGSADSYNVLIQREANYSGGAPFFTNSALLVQDDVSAGTTAFEWAGRFILNNNGAAADSSQNVALYAQASKISTGATWAATDELIDELANPSAGSVTQEYDLEGVGGDASAQRVINDYWGKSFDGNNDTITRAIRINSDSHTIFTDLIQFNLGTRGCTNFINDVATSKFKVTCAGAVTTGASVAATTFLRPGQTIFANLATVDPTPQVGDMLNITDASACTVNTQVTAGSGTTHSCPTVYNGVGFFALVTH